MIGTKAFETCTAHRTRSVSVMCLLLFSEMRVIVVNPQTPTRTFVALAMAYEIDHFISVGIGHT